MEGVLAGISVVPKPVRADDAIQVVAVIAVTAAQGGGRSAVVVHDAAEIAEE
jgi:hypothetical protein